MTVAYAIARRELSSYFFSPIAYVAITLFLLVSGILFTRDFEPGAAVSLRTLFDWMVYLLVFIVPVLSMGLISSEWDKGTIETMMTAPVSDAEVVLGKFAGAMSFFLVMLLPTLTYVVLLSVFGRPEPGPLLSGYLGIVLVGGLFTAVGIFCSSLTRSQVVAAVISAAVLAAITILPYYASDNPRLTDFWRQVVRQMVFQRYTDFSRGVIDLSHVVAFLSATAVFLFATTKVLESRRWK